MSEIIGAYLSEVNYITCCLTALHDGSRVALWDHGDRMASYLASWIDNHLAQALDPAAISARGEAVGPTVRFALNELIDNAIKYRCGGDLIISVGVTASAIVLSISNEIVNFEVKRLQRLLQGIIAEDPAEGLRSQVEANANLPGVARTSAGIGYRSLRYDYKIALGWQFAAGPADTTRLTTMAHLPLPSTEER